MYLNPSFSPKSINKRFVLVRINRQKQREKRQKVGSILLPPGQVHQNYNQQQGEILMIGKEAQKLIAEMQPGDTLLFHHSIEGQAYLEEQNPHVKLINTWDIYNNEYVDPEWIYYMVRTDFIYGVKKQDGSIFVHPDLILAIAAPDEENNRNLKRVGTLYLFENFKEERKDIEDRLMKMKYEAETHKERAGQIMEEMERITKSLNKKRAGAFMPVFIGKRIKRAFYPTWLDTTYCIWYEFLGSKNTTPQVTTINVDGYDFYILRADFILMAKKLKMFSGQQETISFDDHAKEIHQMQEDDRSRFTGEARIVPGLIAESPAI